MENLLLSALEQSSSQDPQKAVDMFLEIHPEWEPYDTPRNEAKLYEFCNVQAVPITLCNLEVAFYTLTQSGEIQKSPEVIAEAESQAINQVAEEFSQARPQWEKYRSAHNGARMDKWREERNLPPTLENVIRSFDVCVQNRIIHPVPRYTAPVTRRLTQAEQSLIDRPHHEDLSAEEARALSPVGAGLGRNDGRHLGVDPKLRKAYQESLARNKGRLSS